jgi:hypothetical protein
MGLLEQMAADIAEIKAALAGTTGAAKVPGATGATEGKATTAKPASKPAAKGPTLEEVQDAIRGLTGREENPVPAEKIKAEITKLGGKRAGDFEGDATKLKKLMDALTALGEEGGEEAAEDDDLL